jgi:uncharacterized SAM-binding protein YcdF (DUF218 family)
MFFVLAKILGFFALPSNIAITLGLVGIVLMWTRFARAGRRLAAASLILLAVFGLTPFGNALILPLEQRFPAWSDAAGPPDGIIVLGGALDSVVSGARHDIALNEAAERMTEIAALAKKYPAARILFSGGAGQLVFQGANESDLALRLFESFGIARSRITVDDRSRDTVENARFSKAIANPKPGERWLLVTSAYHMPRSIGSFRGAGFSVEAYPVDWRTRGMSDLVRPFTNVGDGLRRTDTAAREWVGLFIYWASGYLSELWPGPVQAGCDTASAVDRCRR